MDSSGACKRLNSKAFVNWVKETPFHILAQTLGTKKNKNTKYLLTIAPTERVNAVTATMMTIRVNLSAKEKRITHFATGAPSMQHQCNWCQVFIVYTYAVFTVFKIGLSPDESSAPLVLSAGGSISSSPRTSGTTVDGEGKKKRKKNDMSCWFQVHDLFELQTYSAHCGISNAHRRKKEGETDGDYRADIIIHAKTNV